ncbi:MAG TPA: hypothetical protein VG870_13935 [Chitinophagaceae bacterium]|nr:hypothetical protein [Chitinophagaceae bacterium]
MEVHHHPKVEKKGFREYLLEFLMIFLAVTLGFFAETFRENLTEHSRARVFAASLLRDLEADTAQLDAYRTYYRYAADNADTLIGLLSRAEPREIPSGKLYWYGLWGGARRYFIPNDATFQQMKSSGTLRYLTGTVAGGVARYDRLCRQMQENDLMQNTVYTEVRKSRSRIFDFRYNDIANNIVQANAVAFDQRRIDSFMATNPPLLSYDRTQFNEYVELVRSRFMRSHVTQADSLIRQATELINELKKAYDPA